MRGIDDFGEGLACFTFFGSSIFEVNGEFPL